MIAHYKTSEELMAYFCDLLQNVSFVFGNQSTTMAKLISGNIYQEGFRPRDSKKEDIVVNYTSGVTTGDIVRGEMTINIYVPDIHIYNDGTYMKDSKRLNTLANAMQTHLAALVYGLTSYRIIQLEPLKSVKDKELHQHFIVAHLQYEYCLIN